MDSGLQVLDSGLFLVSGTWIQDSRPLLPVMFNTAALLRTVKSRWRIVRSSVQTVSIANSSYSGHIRSVSHYYIRAQCTRGLRSVRSVRINKPYIPSLAWNILRPTNEMQFSDRKQLFTDCTRVLRSVGSVRIVTWLIRTVTVLDNLHLGNT